MRKRKMLEDRRKLYDSINKSVAIPPSTEKRLREHLDEMLKPHYDSDEVHLEVEFEEDEKLSEFFGHSRSSKIYED